MCRMWTIGGKNFESRMLLGTAKYPSPSCLKEAIEKSSAQIVTVSLRRQKRGDANRFWDVIRSCKVDFLPNTAGCRSVQEVVTTARLAREIFKTHWIKLETVGDEYTLQPDPFILVEAAQILISDGFEVFPYMTEDLVVAERLISMGCKILMPWASPIGSGQGVINPAALQALRVRFPKVNLIVDAGIGAPSHAAKAMELGFDGVLLNTAVSLSSDPVKMAEAFALSIQAGRLGYEAGLMQTRNFSVPSTPIVGTPFWHGESL